MKKNFLTLIPLIIILINCAGSAPPAETPTPAGMTLDQAIGNAAARIDERLTAGSKIALLNFSSPSDRFSSYALDELEANLLDSGKLTVVDRKEVDLIRNEFDFQFSGEVGDDSIQDIGRMLGAQSIVSGSLTEIGGSYRIVIRVLNVQSATVEAQYRTDIAADNRVLALLEGGRSVRTVSPARQTAPSSSAQTTTTPAAASAVTPAPVTAPTPAAAPAPAPVASTAPTTAVSTQTQAAPAIAIEVTAKLAGKLFFQNREIAALWDDEIHIIPIEGPGTYTVKMVFSDHEETRSVVINARGTTRISFGGVYTVGQAGPAGGLIFFDKGFYSDGWRYLEAASADIAGTAEWGAYGREIGRTNTGRGSGKQNTQIIADYLREIGETGRAAQICQEFRQGGYADWFLPSKDELHLMYENLKQKGLGRLQNGIYWSSSQYNAGNAWYQDFSDGSQVGYHYGGASEKTRPRFVRPIRQF